jgi:NADPH-dependent 2,4-dienoyl-CoA reductase/sulfur reductase-like enzyme
MSHHQHVHYLLLGGGPASSAAAKAIRSIDSKNSLLLISQEDIRPYARPPLSKGFLQGQTPRDALFIDKVDFFTQQDIELHTGVRAMQLDTHRKVVAFDNHGEIAFEKLLIATGASSRHLTIPGAQLPNVHYLRNVNDADRLRNAVEKARKEGLSHAMGRGRATIIGSGLLGPELAATFTKLGIAVDLVVGAPHAWKKYAGETVGRYLTRYLEKHGVHVHLQSEPARFEGDGRVQRVVLNSGATLPCDFVVAATGINPNKEILRGTAIESEKAILVDNHCRTSLPDIFAAGDVAAIFDPLYGKHRQIDHWENAVLSGEIAGKNMAGADASYNLVSAFDSQVFDLKLRVFGAAKYVDHRLIRDSGQGDEGLLEFGIAADGRIAQIMALNYQGDNALLHDLVKARLQVKDREEQIKDPQTPLANLLHT